MHLFNLVGQLETFIEKADDSDVLYPLMGACSSLSEEAGNRVENLYYEDEDKDGPIDPLALCKQIRCTINTCHNTTDLTTVEKLLEKLDRRLEDKMSALGPPR